MNEQAFVFGDVQGQHKLLKTLLFREGLLSTSGERLCPDVKVISIGDLGHFARYPMGSQSITEADDFECFKLLFDGVIDLMLWGNHDRPLMGHLHRDEIFGGYWRPDSSFIDLVKNMRSQGRIKLADSFGDFLLTHAGLHKVWGNVLYHHDPAEIADMFNTYDEWLFDGIKFDPELTPIIRTFVDTIGYGRGGSSEFGGILWRDNRDEPLYKEIRQIYGHTASREVKIQETELGPSYCIDISKADKIGAIWLPEERVVTISLEDLDV